MKRTDLCIDLSLAASKIRALQKENETLKGKLDLVYALLKLSSSGPTETYYSSEKDIAKTLIDRVTELNLDGPLT